MTRSKSPVLPISLFDIFLGSGRTIRRPTGPPGIPGKTELVRVRRRVSGQKNGGEEPKATSAKGSNKENTQSGSQHSSKKEENKSSSSKKDDKKSDSKPTNDKAADANKADEEPKTNGDKPQAAQNSSDPVFTPEEDGKILLMASEGKKMNEIAKVIGKTKKQTNNRFNEIKPTDWKMQKGGKHGNTKAEVVDEKNAKADDKQITKTDKKVEDRKSKSNAIDRKKQEQTPSAAILLAGKHEHAHAHRHEVRHDHHIHVHDSHPRRSAHDTPHDRHDSGHTSHHSRSRPCKSHHRPAASVTPSSRTAYTIKTMPSLAEDDLFSFGELQALSELIGKDMEGMWHRVSAAFFGMTGRRIAAEDIKEKFAGLEVE